MNPPASPPPLTKISAGHEQGLNFFRNLLAVPVHVHDQAPDHEPEHEQGLPAHVHERAGSVPVHDQAPDDEPEKGTGTA